MMKTKYIEKEELTIEKSRQIFKDIIASLGGNLRWFLCGGAAVSPEVLKGWRDFGIDTFVGGIEEEIAEKLFKKMEAE